MKFALCLLCLVCLAGCSSMKQVPEGSMPQLLVQSPLPLIPVSISKLTFNLDIVLFVLEDGTIGKARMLQGSGDAEWDTLALNSMKQWRFAPARSNNQPISTWYHMKNTLRYDTPRILNLAEILCTTAEEADTVYTAIEEGQNFGDLAMWHSVDPSREMKGLIGDMNINLYPENIRKHLSKLLPQEYTAPIKYGDLYVIFKRMK
jgi:TonB family protein